MAAQQAGVPVTAEDDPWMTDIDTDDEGESTSGETFLIIVESPAETTSISSNDGSAGLPSTPAQQGPPNGPYSGDSSNPWRQKYGWTTQTSTSASNTPIAEHLPSMSPIPTTSVDDDTPPPAEATNQAGIQRPPGGPWQHKESNGGLIAVAAIVPIVALIVIGAAAFFFLRRRKRNQQAASARMTAEEMKQQHHPAPSIHPYMATSIPMPPPFEAAARSLPPSTHDLSTPAPVILGPISSGANGAYQTGIDTSDMVSIVSNDIRPIDPFADNNSISEPPPPYRPNSVAPPSFVSTSRQSSVRTIGPPPATSQTHLIERSPFDDPPEHEANVAHDNDDAISELSGPTLRRSMDAMSAVSDLSYQNEPVVGRTSL